MSRALSRRTAAFASALAVGLSGMAWASASAVAPAGDLWQTNPDHGSRPVPPPAPEPEPTEFTIAVFGDTQTWVFGQDDRFSEAATWLADNAEELNLAHVLHSGDVVNWGWLAPSQYAIADAAYQVLDEAGLPYSLAIGNHDARIVGHDNIPGSTGYGGGAYVNNPECADPVNTRLDDPADCSSPILIRQTQEFNEVFDTDRVGSEGEFEAGLVDNSYTTFSAGGADWMVLTLEMNARPAAIEWATDVVEAHPTHNVLVQTHYYLNPNGSITTSNSGYGATSGTYLYDTLISQYPNISMVFSGHTGTSAQRTDQTVGGNTVVSALYNSFGGQHNAVQLITIDTATGEVSGEWHATRTGGQNFDQYAWSETLSIVQP